VQTSGSFKLTKVDEKYQVLTVEDAETLLLGHVGLVCGPSISRPKASFPGLASIITQRFGTTPGVSYFAAGEEAIRKGAKADDIKAAISTAIAGAPIFDNIKRIAAVRWSAVMSLSLDPSFENELRRAFEARPSGLLVTAVEKFPTVLPLKTMPFFRLLAASMATTLLILRLHMLYGGQRGATL
jgi:hypothetical protein